MLNSKILLNELWQSEPAKNYSFQPEQFERLPESAKRYLSHVLPSEGVVSTFENQLAAAVRLKMHGEIKLNGGWLLFEQSRLFASGRA